MNDGMYWAEGWGYAQSHLEDNGFIQSEYDSTLFAFHTNLGIEEIDRVLQETWGYGYFTKPFKLICTTKMKNGFTNYVIEILPNF